MAPNNSLKLTRRAALSGWLALPAGEAQNPSGGVPASAGQLSSRPLGGGDSPPNTARIGSGGLVEVLMSGKTTKKSAKGAAKVGTRRASSRPRLLAGGNPQIAIGDGSAPVQAYITAMPGWKRAIGRRIDALVVRAVPGVLKAVKWNSPFYGVEGQGWFLNFHCFTKYVKVAFFRGASLRPMPPGESKDKNVRYLDIHEHDQLDEVQLTTWIRQAAALPGWMS